MLAMLVGHLFWLHRPVRRFVGLVGRGNRCRRLHPVGRVMGWGVERVELHRTRPGVGDEDEIAAELEQMGNNALSKKPNQTRISNDLVFDPIDDIPTLSHQTQPKASALSELNERMGTIEGKPSLNDHLKVENKELSNTLSNEPIKDLKKGIGLNDSYLFINELFRGDETMYTRSIKTINGFTNFAEARFWIERELKLKLGWSNNDQVVKHFDQLVRRRFS
jgi:hypothetical protein